jgi:hypothetical protein
MYKCRVIAGSDGFADYNIILYYKPKRKLISRSYYIYRSNWKNENNYDDFLNTVKELNSMSDTEFIKHIKGIIIEEELSTLECIKENNEYHSEINKLNNRGRFTIEI